MKEGGGGGGWESAGTDSLAAGWAPRTMSLSLTASGLSGVSSNFVGHAQDELAVESFPAFIRAHQEGEITERVDPAGDPFCHVENVPESVFTEKGGVPLCFSYAGLNVLDGLIQRQASKHGAYGNALSQLWMLIDFRLEFGLAQKDQREEEPVRSVGN